MGSILRVLSMLATGNVRGLISFVLGLALLGGLWETSLYNVSSRTTATAIMTEAGVELINPQLVHSSLGLSDTGYAALQQVAKADPTKPLAIPGLKPTVGVIGSDIVGKTFADGSRAVYAKVAAAYYSGGPSAVFTVPDQFTQVTQAASTQLPHVPLPSLAAVGLSLQTFTAQGHAQVGSLDKWFVILALACLLLLALLSPRWKRLTTPAWALISGASPGAFVIGLVAFLWARNQSSFAPYQGLLKALASAVLPVYIGALAVGVAALIVAGVGDVVLRTVGSGRAAAARSQARRAPARGPFDQPDGVYRPAVPPSGASTWSTGERGYSSGGSYQPRQNPAANFRSNPERGGTPDSRGAPGQQPARDRQWPAATGGTHWSTPASGPQRSPYPGASPASPASPAWLQGLSEGAWPPSAGAPQQPPLAPESPWSPGAGGSAWPPAPSWADPNQAPAWPPAGPANRPPDPVAPPWRGAEQPPFVAPDPPNASWPQRADDTPWSPQSDDDPWSPRR